MYEASATTAANSAPVWTGHQGQFNSPAPDFGRSIAELTPESLEQTRRSHIAGKSPTDSSDHDKAEGTPSAMEITWELLDPVRDSDQPAIIPDLTDYTYHEDDEEDDASIHHDSDTIFVADYQNGHLSNGASRSAQDLTSQAERVLPTHLNDLLEQWYARHGRTAPNCVCKRSESAMSELWCSKTSHTPVTWLHRSGVPLNVTWYPLPGNQGRSQGNSLKLIVVSGPGVAPCIVSYKNAGGHIAGIKEHGVVYRTWRGLDGDNDGFEFSPSVIKMSRGTGKQKSAGMSSRPDIQAPPPSIGSRRPESTLRCERCTTQHLGCDRKQPTCSRCATTGRSCYYRGPTISRPEALKVETTLDGMDLQRSERARKPTRRYNSEEFAPALKRKIPDTSFDRDDDEDSNALLSKFMTSPPLISTSSPSFLRASKSKPWVCYLCGDATTNKKDMRSHFRQVHGLNPDETRMKWADSREGTQKVQTFVIVPNMREAPAAARAAVTEAVPGVETTAVAEKVQEEAPRQDHDQKLEEHIKNNTKIMFFSRTQTPRVRLFAACDSAHKLFAQATAGGVFSREHARVLAVEVEDQESELPIVEDDAEDFELFVKQVREASCWRLRDGQVEGDTVVHVREKLGMGVDGDEDGFGETPPVHKTVASRAKPRPAALGSKHSSGATTALRSRRPTESRGLRLTASSASSAHLLSSASVNVTPYLSFHSIPSFEGAMHSDVPDLELIYGGKEKLPREVVEEVRALKVG